ncbi:MAG TPA: hypothetical protein VFY29_13590 [Terriglobia bacterium]|nr:hypothetical protein [Terriglobia bacterium]
MKNATGMQEMLSPSIGKLLLATLVALVVAAVVLVVAVLPAEYGIDPMGTGKVLGLTTLAQTTQTPAAAEGSEFIIAPVLEPAVGNGAPHVRNAFIAQPKGYRIDSREIILGPREGMEIKYNMKKGAGLVYSWTADRNVAFEFHGDPNVKPEGFAGTDYYESYELDDKTGKDQQHGTFVAPTSGIHGWFWENPTTEQVKLKLVSAGFYDWIQESRHDKQTAIDAREPE